MNHMDIAGLVASVASLVLALVAIWLSEELHRMREEGQIAFDAPLDAGTIVEIR